MKKLIGALALALALVGCVPPPRLPSLTPNVEIAEVCSDGPWNHKPSAGYWDVTFHYRGTYRFQNLLDQPISGFFIVAQDNTTVRITMLIPFLIAWDNPVTYRWIPVSPVETSLPPRHCGIELH